MPVLKAWRAHLARSAGRSGPTSVSESGVSSLSASSISASSLPAAPFVLELSQEFDPTDGRGLLVNATHFTPQARLLLGEGLHESGLPYLLSAAQWQALWWVLLCLRPDGRFAATVPHIARLSRCSPRSVRRRLDALCRVRWRDQPLVQRCHTPSGLHLYQPAASLFERRTKPVHSEEETLQPRFVERAQIIARNRARYARPVEEVEAAIWAFYGKKRPSHTPSPHQRPSHDSAVEADAIPEKTDQDNDAIHQRARDEAARADFERRLALHLALREVGLETAQCHSLLTRFDPERIQRQLDWLPWRHARRPAAYLIRAVEGDYDPPAGWDRDRERRSPEPGTVSQEETTKNGTMPQNSAP